MRFRLSEILLSIALIACGLAWVHILWKEVHVSRTVKHGEWPMGILLCATILIFAFGSRIWPNLVINAGAALLMIIFGLLGLAFITFLAVAVFG